MSGLFCILLQMVTVIHFSWQALSIEGGDILHYKAGAMNVINDGKPTYYFPTNLEPKNNAPTFFDFLFYRIGSRYCFR